MLVPLNQSSYNMKIIEDLGFTTTKQTSKTKVRVAIF